MMMNTVKNSVTKYVTFDDSWSSSTTSIARSFSRSSSAFLPGPAGGGSKKANLDDDDDDDDDGKISRVDNSPSSALAMVSMQLVKSAVKISGVVSFWKDVAMEFSFHIR